MVVFLVPAGRDRFELYSEVGEELAPPPAREEGRFRRWAHTVNVQWHELVEAARRGALAAGSRAGATPSSAVWPRRSPSSGRCGPCGRGPARRCGTRRLSRSTARSPSSIARWPTPGGIICAGSSSTSVLLRLVRRLLLRSWSQPRRVLLRVPLHRPPAVVARGASGDGRRDLDVRARSGARRARGAGRRAARERAPRVAAIAARLNLPRLSAFFDRVSRADPA